jgi:sugar phosphate isomerase/epimerase
MGAATRKLQVTSRMHRVLSTHLFVNHRLTTVWLDKIHQLGVPEVEIFCARQHLDYRDRAQINELGHWFRDSKLTLHSLHAPMYSDDMWGRSGPNSHINLTEPVKSKRLDMLDEIKRAVDIAEVIPFRYLIQHLGVSEEDFDEHKVDCAFTALEELNLFARERGVEVLLENIPNQLSSAERLIYFLDTTHLKLNVCLDVGHANLNEGVATAFKIMKSRIRSTHLHDNGGDQDSHLWPLFSESGTINWKETMDLLGSLPGDFPLLLELRELPEFPLPQSLDTVKQIFEKLEAL